MLSASFADAETSVKQRAVARSKLLDVIRDNTDDLNANLQDVADEKHLAGLVRPAASRYVPHFGFGELRDAHQRSGEDRSFQDLRRGC